MTATTDSAAVPRSTRPTELVEEVVPAAVRSVAGIAFELVTGGSDCARGPESQLRSTRSRSPLYALVLSLPVVPPVVPIGVEVVAVFRILQIHIVQDRSVYFGIHIPQRTNAADCDVSRGVTRLDHQHHTIDLGGENGGIRPRGQGRAVPDNPIEFPGHFVQE